MFSRLLLLFIFIPLIELYILIDIGSVIGSGPTIALIICTGVVGAYLARLEGFRTFVTLQQKLGSGELPADEMLDGLIILIAGVVLITPGILTDLFGFLMLFRPTRTRFKTWLKNRFAGHINIHHPGGSATFNPDS